MAVAAWPSAAVPGAEDSFIWQPSRVDVVQRGNFGQGSEEILPRSFEWVADMRFAPRLHDDAHPFLAVLNALRGASGTIAVPNFQYVRRLGTIGGTVTVDGAGQTGTSLATTGWASDGVVMLAGEYVEILEETGVPRLHQVLADATAAAGDATLVIEPALRKPPPNGSTVLYDPEVALLRTTMRLVDGGQIRPNTMWAPPAYGRYLDGISLSFTEAFRQSGAY